MGRRGKPICYAPSAPSVLIGSTCGLLIFEGHENPKTEQLIPSWGEARAIVQGSTCPPRLELLGKNAKVMLCIQRWDFVPLGVVAERLEWAAVAPGRG